MEYIANLIRRKSNDTKFVHPNSKKDVSYIIIYIAFTDLFLLIETLLNFIRVVRSQFFQFTKRLS